MKSLLLILVTSLILPLTTAYTQERKELKITLPKGRYLLIKIHEPSKENALRADSIISTFGELKEDSDTQYTFSPLQQPPDAHEKIVFKRSHPSLDRFQALWYSIHTPEQIDSIGEASVDFSSNATSATLMATLTNLNSDGSSNGKTFCRLVYLD